uniref:Uncharacterized protein n=1 Tax=Pithovirus LCDPAC02 TaxID=2506601 RepID=A0A481YNE7_9VIRU|nr:MAG: hypothetical protein LCDPAC02_00210 [Pithovirus LCDPAC02]
MQICNGTKIDGVRCKFKAKKGNYCGHHNKNNIICPICNITKISKFNVIQCWECIKNEKQKKFEIRFEQTEKLECSDDFVLDVIIHIFKFCNSDTKLELRKLCNYTYDKLVPTELYNRCSKIVFNYKSSMDSLQILHSWRSRPNILKYINRLPNLIELYLYYYNPTQKFLDKLSINMETLVFYEFNFDESIIDLSRFTNLKKICNIRNVPRDFISHLSKLEEVSSCIELDLPKSVTSFNGFNGFSRYVFNNLDFLKDCNIVRLERFRTNQDLNFLSNSLEYFQGGLDSINQISDCKKLKHLIIKGIVIISEDTNVYFPNLEYLEIEDASRFVNSTKLKKLICNNDDLSFIEFFLDLEYLKCCYFYNVKKGTNFKHLKICTIDNQGLKILQHVNADYFEISFFENNIKDKWDEFPYTKEEFPIFENIRILQIYSPGKNYFLSIPFENFPNLEILYVLKTYKYMFYKPKKFKIKKC